MHSPRRSLILIAAGLTSTLGLAGCSASRETTGGMFVFDVEGASYQILSAVDSEGNGANYLLCRVDGRTVLRALDGDQDGVIESVLTGAMSVQEANRIYSLGIEVASSGGKVDRREAPRLFRLEERGQTWSVRTVADGPGSPYNTFSIIDSDGTHRAVATDEGADGILDRLVEGDYPLGSAQPLYRTILDRGQLLGRIVRENNRFIVQPEHTP